ncbi:hypothetical protein QQZ08_008815 [Neonectria magnoliae]|uniref:F-box domain-containing protein n=1 Tax=Neonectria magnoliae TaxID=2732573 RepID=A0ABR1HTS5_9HYPO
MDIPLSPAFYSLPSSSTSSESLPDGCPFLTLPPELVDTIIRHLSPHDLISVAATCSTLRKHALSDIIWHPLVQENVPGVQLTSPAPCGSYHELYAAHDLVWFLPRYKIWFCDRDLMGGIILIRYDPRRGCIEGYRLLAVGKPTTVEPWPTHSEVSIHGFEPQVGLHLDKPVLRFRIRQPGDDGGFSKRPGANRFADEISMELYDDFESLFSNFLLARPLDPKIATQKLTSGYPYGNVWPPPAMPAHHHISRVLDQQDILNLDPNDRPRRRSEVSDQTFRVRKWMEMAGGPAPVQNIGWMQALTFIASSVGIHVGEELISYSTVDPDLYTPTPLKPWRGIWVGDYSGHGCEFILIHQPDDPPVTDAELGLERADTETDAEWESRKTAAHTYRGRLEAIKLTGDPNVPRGEHTFIVDDLGPAGYIGDATDPPFEGVRVVNSRGRVAGTGFVGGESKYQSKAERRLTRYPGTEKFIESQLFLISHDRLAQYWVGFEHISFFERVDIDKLLKP